MASNDSSPQRRERTASENNSDVEYDEIETLCDKVEELYNNERKAEEARRAKRSESSEGNTEAERTQRAETSEASSSAQSETGSESDYEVSLTRLTQDLYLHRQRAARHGRVDRLEKFVELLASLPKEVQKSVSSTDVGKKLFGLLDLLAEAAQNGCVQLITFICRRAQLKESEMKQAARQAFLFQRTDVTKAFAQLGVDMDENGFLADVVALERTPDTGLVPCGAQSSCTDTQTHRHLELLKAALRGERTQVVQCLEEVGRTGAWPPGCRLESDNEHDYWKECQRRVLCYDRWASSKKDENINFAILLTIARGHHQALRVLLGHAGLTWEEAFGKPVSIAGFHTTPMNLAVLSGCVDTVQVLLDHVHGELSVFSGFLFNAMMEERLDILGYLLRLAMAIINGRARDKAYSGLLMDTIYFVLSTAIERRSRSVVKLIFKEVKREELQLNNSHSRSLDQLVQDSKSLPILRAFLLWCPDYVKTQLQIKPSLEETWREGYNYLLQVGGEVKNRSTLPKGSISEERLELGLWQTCLQFVRMHLHKPIQDSVDSVPLPNIMKLRLQFK